MIHARGLVQTFTTQAGPQEGRGPGRRRRRPRRRRGRGRRASSVPTAPARPPPCGCSPRCCARPRARPRWRGTTWSRESQQVRRSIGYVSQAGGVSSYARAGDEVVDHGMLYGLSQAEATKRGQELFEQLDLPGLWTAHAQADVRGSEAPPRHRDGPGPRPDADLPRRADHRTRPPGARQPLGAHRQPAQTAWRDGVPDHALPRRGRRPQRPDHDHRPGQDHRERHRREPEGGRLR